MKSKILPILFALIFHFANGKCNLPKSTLLFSINSFHTSRLGVINTTQNILTVQIVNVSGNIYLNEEVKGGTNFFKLLDLRNLPDGFYEVKLLGLDKEIKKEFTKINGKVEIFKSLSPKFFFTNNEEIHIFYNNLKEHSVNISIEQDGLIIFNDENIINKVINKRYSLKNLSKGKYTVKVYTPNKTFDYLLELK